MQDDGTTGELLILIINDLPYAIPACVLLCLFQSHFLWTSREVLRGRRVGGGQKPPRWKRVPAISTAVLLILNLIFFFFLQPWSMRFHAVIRTRSSSLGKAWHFCLMWRSWRLCKWLWWTIPARPHATVFTPSTTGTGYATAADKEGKGMRSSLSVAMEAASQRSRDLPSRDISGSSDLAPSAGWDSCSDLSLESR